MFLLTLCAPNTSQTVSSIKHSIITSTPVSSAAGRARLAASFFLFILNNMLRYTVTLHVPVCLLRAR